jgi:hypothetical protein
VSTAASIAHVEAVAVALDFLERRAGATRQQVDGEHQRIPTGLAVATFVHRTSREGDPQLHTHCVAANLGRRPDGSYAALDAAPLYEWGKAAGCVYQEELRRRLTNELGIEWDANRNGCRESSGLRRPVSRSVGPVEGLLDGDGGGHCIGRPGEGGHDPVAQALHHLATSGLDGSDQQPVVDPTKRLGGLISQLRPQFGGTDEVREEHRGSRPGHRSSGWRVK